MEILWQNHIHSNASILLGKPIIKNTRISVELILELLASGWSNDQLLESYPSLTNNDIKAVFIYLKECIQEELFFPIQTTA
jgi:uncharacterized protein (DUF433 family)